MKFKYIVNNGDLGKSVHNILKDEFEFSRRLISKLKRNKAIFCNGKRVYVTHIVEPGDIVEANVNFDETSKDIEPVKMDLNIVYEDNALIALDKPAGVVVNPIGIHKNNTLANGLAYYFNAKDYKIKIRPVNRLDMDTTGIILFAKNGLIHDRLRKQMIAKQYYREYIGIVHGHPAEPLGCINLPIARSPGSIILREVSKSGAMAITNYEVMEYLPHASLLRFTLETGRTHQIRVHSKAIGHPLMGDSLYSHIKTPLITRQALHACCSKFTHPLTGKEIEISSPMPRDMKKLLGEL